MKSRPMWPKSFNARTTSGRLRLRSSAALQALQTSKTTESEVLLSLLEGLLPDAPAVTEPRFTISLANAPKNPKQLELQWSEAMQLYQDLQSALQMSYGECSGPH